MKNKIKDVQKDVDKLTDELVSISYDMEEMEKAEQVRSLALQINALVRGLSPGKK